jgi:hypothetical protein
MDRETLQKKIADNAAWEIIEEYLNGDCNQITMYSRLVDRYEGDDQKANADAWEVNAWENGEGA